MGTTTSPPDFHYTVHGLHVVSNQPMPALTPAPAPACPDLCIWIGPMAALCQRHPAIDLSETVSLAPIRLWRLSTSCGQEVVVQRVDNPKLTLLAILSNTGDVIEVGWHSNGNQPPDELERTIANYFLNGWLGMALRLSGQLVLHGNVVSADGGAIAWLGDKGAGKSTLTAAFVAAGYPLLSDDQVMIWPGESGVGVAPGIMRMHLWPESLAAMAHMEDGYHFDQPFGVFPKGYVAVAHPEAPSVEPALTPLRAIYVLQPRRSDRTRIQIETPSPGRQFHLLLSHCLARKILPLSAEQQRTEFRAVGELQARVPVRLLTLPNDLARLPEVVQMLADEHAHG